MKYVLIISILTCVFSSCMDKTSSKSQSLNKPYLNTYKSFDEPGANDVSLLKFYMLIVDSRLLSTRLISIREESNAVYCNNKIATNDQVFLLQTPVEHDTITFKYTATHFKLSVHDIDTLRSWISTFNIGSLKDSISSNHIDGGMKEIIIYDGRNFHHSYQTHGSINELSSNLRTFIEKVQERYRR